MFEAKTWVLLAVVFVVGYLVGDWRGYWRCDDEWSEVIESLPPLIVSSLDGEVL